MVDVIAVLRQTWWAPIAGLLAVMQLVLGAVSLGGDADLESRVASLTLLVVGGAITALGLFRRPRHRPTGNALLLIGCAFAAIWLWTVVLPFVAVVVAAGVLTSGWRTEPTAHTGSLA